MAKSVTVRDVPEDVISALAARAAGQGRSLQEYLKGELAKFAARPSPQDWALEVERTKRATTIRLSAAEILAARVRATTVDL